MSWVRLDVRVNVGVKGDHLRGTGCPPDIGCDRQIRENPRRVSSKSWKQRQDPPMTRPGPAQPYSRPPASCSPLPAGTAHDTGVTASSRSDAAKQLNQDLTVRMITLKHLIDFMRGVGPPDSASQNSQCARPQDSPLQRLAGSNLGM